MVREQTALLISKSKLVRNQSRFEEDIFLPADHVEEMDHDFAVFVQAEMLHAEEKGGLFLTRSLALDISKSDPDHPIIHRYL